MKRFKSVHGKTRNVWLILGCTALLLSGCGNDAAAPAESGQSPTPQATATATPSAQPAVVNVDSNLPFRYPLTGLPTETDIKTRPYMVMVENAPQARPQTGLDQADIVYEILAEGEITRFVAVYQSHEAATIGPVRSIRPYFVEIGDALDAVIVHAGWSQDAMAILAGRKLAHLDEVYGDGAYYWRSTDRKPPHNLYTSVDKIKQGAANHKFREEWNGPILTFAKDGQSKLTGSAVTQISIPYIMGYVVSYAYDAADGTYKRSMDGKPHLDKETGKQLAATNLLVLEAEHRVLDKEGRRDVDVFGPGKGQVFQQGKSQDVTWERKNGIIRVYADGKEIPLVPGTTWVQIVPKGTAVTAQ